MRLASGPNATFLMLTTRPKQASKNRLKRKVRLKRVIKNCRGEYLSLEITFRDLELRGWWVGSELS